LTGRQDRPRRFRYVYPPFSGKENKMSGIFIDSVPVSDRTTIDLHIERKEREIEREREREKDRERERREYRIN